MSAVPSLSRAQIQELERELRSEQARLERSVAPDEVPDDATSPSGGVPRVPTNAEGGLAVALESRALARHEALGAAIRRIEAGTYGRCASCDNPIPYGRLLVMPEATHCVAC
jgi:RNA polymerase-binding transcription factor DksA